MKTSQTADGWFSDPQAAKLINEMYGPSVGLVPSDPMNTQSYLDGTSSAPYDQIPKGLVRESTPYRDINAYRRPLMPTIVRPTPSASMIQAAPTPEGIAIQRTPFGMPGPLPQIDQAQQMTPRPPRQSGMSTGLGPMGSAPGLGSAPPPRSQTARRS